LHQDVLVAAQALEGDGPVPPQRPAPGERQLRLPQQLGAAECERGVLGGDEADGGGQLPRIPGCPEGGLGDGQPEGLGQGERRALVAGRSEQAQAMGSKPGDTVTGLHEALHPLDELAEDLGPVVAGTGRLEQLPVIELDDEEAEWLLEALRPREFPVQLFEEVALLVELRVPVEDREAVDQLVERALEILTEELEGAPRDPDDVAVAERHPAGDLELIEEGPVGGAQILEPESPAFAGDERVAPGDRGAVLQTE